MKKGCLILFIILFVYGLLTKYPKTAIIIGAIIVVLFIVMYLITIQYRKRTIEKISKNLLDKENTEGTKTDEVNKFNVENCSIQSENDDNTDKDIANEEIISEEDEDEPNEDISCSIQTDNVIDTSTPIKNKKEKIETNEIPEEKNIKHIRKSMKLHEAIAYAIEREGKEIIYRPLLVNYLADLQAYDTPAVKRIVETIVSGGYGERLLKSLQTADYELQIIDIESRIVRNEGYQRSLVHYVLSCVSNALGKTSEQPMLPSESEQSNPQMDIKAQTNGRDLKPYDPKSSLSHYQFPSLDLLEKRNGDDRPYMDESEIETQKSHIIDALKNYDIEVSDIKSTAGPTITFYEVTLAQGTKLSKLRKYEEDIASYLYNQGLRMLIPIPGKGTVGIEIPNDKDNIVGMESILNSESYKKNAMDLPCAIGKTMIDEVFMFDLATMPHLLITGGTGQGKSIGLSAIITSLLYKKHPTGIKFVLIDPKGVEFGMYEAIANQFLAKREDEWKSVITDVAQVERTLSSLCVEMDSRYILLKKAGARNIKDYNNKFISRQLNPEYGHIYLPYMVVVIDEFDVLMTNAGKQIEQQIVKLAHLGHIVGIHLIIATQHPVKAIVTDSILNNIPGRIAFKTITAADSKRVIDSPDAYQLIGRGDMLFIQGNTPIRVQCAYVDTAEISRICKLISEQQCFPSQTYLPDPPMDDASGDKKDVNLNHLDPLFGDVARMVVSFNTASTSAIQRKFEIGYNRAGHLMDQLEQAGIVGPQKGSKLREVLINDLLSLDSVLSSLGVS